MDREDYLSKDTSFQNRMMGGVSKLFKFEYKPIGFSWMIFADRDDFSRAHYNFKYGTPGISGRRACIVFDVTPKKDAGNPPICLHILKNWFDSLFRYNLFGLKFLK